MHLHRSVPRNGIKENFKIKAANNLLTAFIFYISIILTDA